MAYKQNRRRICQHYCLNRKFFFLLLFFINKQGHEIIWIVMYTHVVGCSILSGVCIHCGAAELFLRNKNHNRKFISKNKSKKKVAIYFRAYLYAYTRTPHFSIHKKDKIKERRKKWVS